MNTKANHRQPNLFLEILKGLGANKLTSALLVVIFASSFAVVQVTHSARAQLIKQDTLLQERDELDLEWRYLLVEEEFYSQHARIEEVATTQLQMKRPTSQDEQVIISTNRGEPLTLSDSKSSAKKCYLNVSQRLAGKDIPIIKLLV